MTDALAIALFLSVGAASLFSFVAVVSWSEARRMERESYYKSEVIKKIVESQAAGALDYLRGQEAIAARRRLDNFMLGGTITAACGICVMIILKVLVPASAPPVFVSGIVPLAVGIVLLVYGIRRTPVD